MKHPIDVIRDVRMHWVGDGFPVRSLFSYHSEGDAVSPFLLLDFAGPHAFPPGGAHAHRPPGVGEHPHRGFETVTVVYQGEVAHRDSAGHSGVIGPGDVQWMTAASGIVHEEFHSQAFTKAGGTLEMVQLWVNLRAVDKRSPPKYQPISNRDIPVVPLPNEAGSARVIAGELLGVCGPAHTFTPIHLWDLQLVAEREVALPIPAGFTAMLLVRDGNIVLYGGEKPTSITSGELAVFDRAGEGVGIVANEPSHALVLAGEPIDEPIVGQGPFVMNTRDEIRQAIADFQSGAMGRL